MPYTLIPNFLREGGVRAALQAFYNAVIGSTENAKIISETDPDKISSDMGSGTPLSKNCFSASVMWLQHLKDVARLEFYRDYFQTPFQLSAAYVLGMRACPSARLTGYMISKSDPFFEKFYGEVIDFTFAVPELGSTLMVRCPYEDVEHIESTTCTLNNAQPIPLVNRMHMVRGRFVEPAREQLRLADLRFMETDIESFDMNRQSLAFENFCEFWSEFYGRTLGIPRVIAGSVKVGQEFLEIEDFSGRAKMRLRRPAYLGEVPTGPSRVLVVYPYSLGRNPKPETLAVEPIKSEYEFESKPIGTTGGGEIVQLFLSTTKQIKSLKRDAYAPAQKLLDEKMLQPVGIIDILKHRGVIRGVLMFLVHEQDVSGRTEKGHLHRFSEFDVATLTSVVAEELAAPIAEVHDALYWLDGFGLISMENMGSKVTSLGSKVVTRLLEEGLIPKLSGLLDRKTIFLPDAARTLFVPSSTMLHALSDMEERGTVYHAKCKLFWSRTGRNAMSEAERQKLVEIKKKIFTVLDSSPHSLHTSKIQKGVAADYNCFELGLVLEWLESEGDVCSTRPYMWFRKLENKIRDALLYNPDLFFSLEQLVSLARYHEKDDLLNVMEKLKKEGHVARVGDFWTSVEGPTDVKTLEYKFVKFMVRQFILGRQTSLMEDIWRYAGDVLFDMKNIYKHPMTVVDEVLVEMQEKKEIERFEETVVVLKDPIR